jgi:hypothetical protein
MDWSGFTSGPTANGSQVLTTTVDQVSYLFQETILAAGSTQPGDTLYPAIVIPTNSMSTDTYQLTVTEYDYTSNSGVSYVPATMDLGVRSVLVTYNGPNWPTGTYRVYYTGSLSSNTNNTTAYYWKGATKTP